MKKLLVGLALLLTLTSSAVGLTACKNDEHPHVYKQEEVKATCTRQGYTKYTCECGHTYNGSYVDALGHDIKNHDAKETNCYEVGYDAYEECLREECDYSTCVEIPMLEHNWVNGYCTLCSGEYYSKGLEFTLINNETEYSVSKGDCVEENVVIPSVYRGKPVTTIGASAFSDCTELTSIIIPESVTSIGASAFKGCKALSFTEDNNGVYLLNENNEYLLIDIVDVRVTTFEINVNTKVISDAVFSKCANLTSIVIPNNVNSIGAQAFSGCDALVYTEDNNGLYLGNSTNEYLVLVKLKESENPITSFSINSNTKVIGDAVFSNCAELTSIIIPDSVISIGAEAFSGCVELTSIIIPDSVKTIGTSAFANCDKLANVTLGNGVETIGDSAFSGCNLLENITVDSSNERYTSQDGILYNKEKTQFVHIPKSIKGSVTIPNTVTSITSSTFASCDLLEAIVVEENNENYASQDGILYNKEKTEFIHIPKAIKGNITIPNTITVFVNGEEITPVINSSTLIGCDSLESITVDGSHEYYASQDGILYNKDKTEIVYVPMSIKGTVTIPNSITAIVNEEKKEVLLIDSSTFAGRDKLEAIVVDESHEYYSSQDGVLYNKKETEFIHVPKAINGSVNIPDKITRIPSYAFSDCVGLTNIYISDSVTSFGANAFSGCVGLISIEIPDSVTSIGAFAFNDCTAEIIWGGTAIISAIGANAFSGYQGLNITIPDSVMSIGDSAFSDCTQITTIIIPEKVTSIGESAFADCLALIEINFNAERVNTLTSSSNVFANAGSEASSITVTIGENVTKIPAYLLSNVEKVSNLVFSGTNVATIENFAFSGTAITSIVIPAGVTEIGEGAFSDCAYLEDITISNSVTSVNSSALNNCGSLESIVVESGNSKYHSADNSLIETESRTLILGSANSIIPTDGSVTSIGSSAFYGRGELLSIVIPDSIISIGSYAFYSCNSLTSITIPKKVMSIGSSAFADCLALTEINFNATLMDNLTSSSNVFANAGSETSGITVTIGSNVARIPAYLLSNVEKVSSVVFSGTNVARIEEFAFSGTTITSIDIPASITNISADVFSDCNVLESIVVDTDNNVYSNQDGILYNINKTEFVHIPKAITGSVTIPNTIMSIPSSAFSNCVGLTNIYIPDSVTSFGANAFSGCVGLISIEIPDSVTSIGAFAFNDCTAEIIWGGTAIISAIGANAFSGYQGLNITIPDSVMSIGDSAFSDCTQITTIIIPEKVTSIGASAFNGCTALTEIKFNATIVKDLTESSQIFANVGQESVGVDVIIGSNVTKIPAYLFENFANMSKLTIGSKVARIGEGAFNGCASLAYIIVDDDNTIYSSQDGVLYNKGKTAFIHIPLSVTGPIVIPNTITKIEAYTFSGRTLLTSVTLQSDMQSIGYAAFYNCKSLTEINFNATALEDLTHSNDAFYKAGIDGAGITLNVGANVTRIPEYLFHIVDSSTYANSPKITEVVFAQDSVCQSIGGYAFSGCKDLVTINLPDSLTVIETYAFSDCSSLIEITIPDSVETLGYSAFENCSALTVLIIGEGVQTISFCAFHNCSSLDGVIIPESVTEIERSAFKDCGSLSIVCYAGTSQQWEEMTIELENYSLEGATVYYYSETEPALNGDGTAYIGNYWRYINDIPAVWVK